MAATVRLTVLSGAHRGSRFCFRGGCVTTLGRAPSCEIHLAGTERDQLISRQHCQFHLDGPNVHVCDLGSSNGTFLNGKQVEQAGAVPTKPCKEGSCIAAACDGDIITVGGTTLQVHIIDCQGHGGGDPDWPEAQIVKCNCAKPC
jgi:pSer/pThr/pTyr-binding forkhead associated (FHA) protein